MHENNIDTIADNNKRPVKYNIRKNLPLIAVTVIITLIITVGITLICYFSLRPKMTIVFYDAEYVMEPIGPDYYQEQVNAYFRLNSDDNLTLEVKDFSILNNGKWEEALKVEYSGRNIKTSFKTDPNKPILKVCFYVPNSTIESGAIIKYKDREMRIGEFVQIR